MVGKDAYVSAVELELVISQLRKARNTIPWIFIHFFLRRINM